MSEYRRCGAVGLGDGSVRWRVWAPRARSVNLITIDGDRRRTPRPMEGEQGGYFTLTLPNIPDGQRSTSQLASGYDGAPPYATQHSYGGPEALQRLVDAAHKVGLAVFLDVVYNHVGPEGNYLNDFGPYFTNKYNTPWGAAVNYDDKGSDPVRDF